MMTTSDDRLDPLLDAWAHQHRLDDADADSILRSILQEPRATLAATWWSNLNDQVTAAVLRATSPADALWAAPAEGAFAA